MRAALVVDALTESDTFDVRRAGEHIHWLDPGELIVACLAEKAQVAGDCRGIARDVDERSWRKSLDGAQNARIAASARRVRQGDIYSLIRAYKLINHALDLTFEECDVRDAVHLGVGAGIGHGARR
jgi:hypothetical protein